MLNRKEMSFVLIDRGREIQTRFSADELLRFLAQLKIRAEEAGPLIQFAASPNFHETYDQNERVITLRGRTMMYEAQGRLARTSDVAKQYRQFADWYARLNATRPGTLPPEARLELNRALAQRDLVPGVVTLTLFERSEDGEDTPMATVRSQHKIGWGLQEIDRPPHRGRRSDAREVPGRFLRSVPGNWTIWPRPTPLPEADNGRPRRASFVCFARFAKRKPPNHVATALTWPPSPACRARVAVPAIRPLFRAVLCTNSSIRRIGPLG